MIAPFLTKGIDFYKSKSVVTCASIAVIAFIELIGLPTLSLSGASRAELCSNSKVVQQTES